MEINAPQAKDAEGIARSIRDKMAQYSFVGEADRGLA
jgi:hypothetical protein